MESGDDRIAQAALNEPSATIIAWRAEPIPNAFGTPTTEALERVHGVARVNKEKSFTAVAKTVRSIRHSPPMSALPPEILALADAALPWRIEPEVYASGLHGGLPPELRAPRLYAVEELLGDRARIWIEDVASKPIAWDPAVYAAAAYTFGQLAGRYPSEAIQWSFTRIKFDFRRYLATRIGQGVIPGLADEATWTHPFVRSTVDMDLRSDLLELWKRAVELIVLTDSPLPTTLAHGDACPQNLFNGGRPGSFVAIDWGLTGTGPIGSDIVQLIAGRIESGELDPSELAAIEPGVLDGYLRGFRTEGLRVSATDLARCVDACLVLRCVFTALPLERLPAADAATDPTQLEFFAKRARWCRLLVDRGYALLAGKGGSDVVEEPLH